MSTAKDPAFQIAPPPLRRLSVCTLCNTAVGDGGCICGACELPPRKPEADPTGRAAGEPGAKLDAGKAPLYRGVLTYFPKALAAVARVSEAGARKYSWGGWHGVPDGFNRYSDALARHLLAVEAIDADTGLPHAAQVAWNALARLELLLEAEERDLRRDLPEEDGAHQQVEIKELP